MLRSVCVFCGSSFGVRPEYRAAAVELASALVDRGIGLVYGGASRGLMGVLADSVLAAGGHVTGVIPRALEEKEIAHRGLPDLRVVGSMHERKALMADLADAFVALPGGFGTLEEFCEAATWTQLGVHSKPCGLLNVEGYWDPLLALLDRMTVEGFVRPVHRELIYSDPDARRLLANLSGFEPPPIPKWIDERET